MRKSALLTTVWRKETERCQVEETGDDKKGRRPKRGNIQMTDRHGQESGAKKVKDFIRSNLIKPE